jgi:hypothetical protein
VQAGVLSRFRALLVDYTSLEYVPIVSAAQQEALTQHVPTPIIVDLDWPRLGFIELGLGRLVDQLDSVRRERIN